MGDLASILNDLRAELPALESLPGTDVVLATGRPTLVELETGEEHTIPASRVALLARGELAVWGAGRFDRTLQAPDVGTFWMDVPARLEALAASRVLVFDRSLIQPTRALPAAALVSRFAATADALADERYRLDRLRERTRYGGDDPYLRVGEAYAGRIDSRQFVVIPQSWPWSGDRPERALLSLSEYDQVGTAGSDPEDQIAYHQATLWAPIAGGLRMVMAWADHARAVRVSRELFGFRARYARVEVLDDERVLVAIDGQPQLLATALAGEEVPADSWRDALGLPGGPLTLIGQEPSPWADRQGRCQFRFDEDRAWALDEARLELLDAGLGAGFEVLSSVHVRGRFQIVPAL